MPNKNQKKRQIKILENTLRKEKLKKNEYIRMQAALLNLKGFSHKQISEITLKSEDALEKWITIFNKQGIEGLRSKPPLIPRNCKLTGKQKDEIKDLILKNSPKQLGLESEFWNPNSLKQLIKRKFNLVYQSKQSYIELLKYCGFSYQKVEYKDSREDKEYKEHMKLRLQKKLKKGVLQMYW